VPHNIVNELFRLVFICFDVLYLSVLPQVNVDPNSGIFITMNPAGKGYGGRQKLPDNLKQLFRPVAMSKPDNELIAEVILFSEGFKDARNLSRKLVAIFNLSRFVCDYWYDLCIILVGTFLIARCVLYY